MAEQERDDRYDDDDEDEDADWGYDAEPEEDGPTPNMVNGVNLFEYEKLAAQFRNASLDPRMFGKKAHRDQLRYIRYHLEDSLQLCREVVSSAKIKSRVTEQALKLIQATEGHSVLKDPQTHDTLIKESKILASLVARFEEFLDEQLEPAIEEANESLKDIYRKQINMIELVGRAIDEDLS
ncbi:MAG: hypothetical protein HC888_00410 [Candidatus Competibacteraceae bacterium]|nr:hypothetical protein [Candidatus Competibacteraceae bacterium]